jgi:hypothetical protein
MPRVSHNACLRIDPFGSPREADAAAFRRARLGAFRPAMAHNTKIPTTCKEFAAKSSFHGESGGKHNYSLWSLRRVAADKGE